MFDKLFRWRGGKLSRKRDVYEFQVLKFSDVTDKVLAFFFFFFGKKKIAYPW